MSPHSRNAWIPPLGLGACFLLGVALAPCGGIAGLLGTGLALLPLIACAGAVWRYRRRRVVP